MLTGYEQPKYFASLIKASDVFFFVCLFLQIIHLDILHLIIR